MSRNIRDIDSRFHCSIIGTCLSLDEVRTLLQASTDEDLSGCTDYILHGMAVSSAGSFSKLSNKINSRLNSKYRCFIHDTALFKTVSELKNYWRSRFDEGDVAGPYWSVVSHPLCSEELRNQAFGEIHMLSHLAAADERSRREDVKALNESLERAVGRCRAHGRESDELKLENRQLKTENRRLSEKLSLLEHRLAGFREAAAAGEKNEPVSFSRERKKLTLAQKRNSSLESRLAEAEDEICALRECNIILKAMIGEAEGLSRGCCDGCSCAVSDAGLYGRKVLLVGGRASMVPHCRSVVDAMGGEFSYHDGGREQSRLALRPLALGADIIICALDCVSHDASRCVKRICAGGTQKIIMLKNSGLSTFTKELRKAV